MLVSIIANLQQIGRRPPPTPTDSGDGGYPFPQGKQNEDEQRELMIKRMKQDDEDFIVILSNWIANNN